MTRSTRLRALAFTLVSLAALHAPARGAAVVPDGFVDELVADTLSIPVGMAFLPGGRLLVVEQRSARIRMIVGGAGSPLVDVGVVPGVNGVAYERGLLGIAVDPAWPTRPYVYVHATVLGPNHVRISRFRASGDLNGLGNGAITIDPASRYDLIDDIPDNAANHNGGTVRFGPDGMLYVSLGEDAAGCAAQDTVSLRGVILRLDVSRLPDGPGTASRALLTPVNNPYFTHPSPNARLVYALGLRNPFRFGIDPADGALFVADVGEDAWEELDRIEAGGIDLGWPYKEGPANHPASCAGGAPVARAPIFSYDRSEADPGGAAIIGGAVYRPSPSATAPFPAGHRGNVFTSDYFSGHLWRLAGSGGSWVVASPIAGQPSPAHWGEGFDAVSDYAVGPDGSLWYCRQASDPSLTPRTGQIRRVRFTNAPPPPVVPPAASFDAAYPVPSAGAVRFVFTLTREARVGLTIHDLAGRRVRELFPPELMLPGAYNDRLWDGVDDHGRTVHSGLYVARLSVDDDSHERRLVIVR